MKNIQYIILLFTLLFMACSSEESSLELNESIQLSVDQLNFHSGTTSTIDGSAAENEVQNLYVFLFTGTTVDKYYFSTGTWNTTDKKVTINISPATTGTREVYIVANSSTVIKNQLDAVIDKASFLAVYESLSGPWSTNISTPILMVGHKATHNFATNPKLDKIDLERVIAKLELQVTLSEKQQDISTAFSYRFVNFDKRTYVVKPNPEKPDDLLLYSDWFPLSSINDITLSGEKVSSFKIVTYLNERDTPGAIVEIILPNSEGGLLPPPEFVDDVYKLRLPDKVVRNTLYKYEIGF